MSDYTVSFYALDPEETWLCQGPRHTVAPEAWYLALIVVKRELDRGVVVVNQASYVCGDCRHRIEQDAATAGMGPT